MDMRIGRYASVAAVLALLLALPQSLLAQPRLTAEDVHRVLGAAVEHARQIGVPMGIAVVDTSGSLVGYIRMDGAFNHAEHTAISKAYTSASVRRPTHDMAIPPDIANSIALASGGRFTTLPGGIPLVREGLVVGAIGVGGGTGEQDIEVAEAGRQALMGP
jgi:glc operon protein GlcG